MIPAMVFRPGEAGAKDCTKSTEPPGEGRVWFYVRLVQADANSSPIPMLLTTRAKLAADPPGSDKFNDVEATQNCFVSSVPKTARALWVHGKAPGFQSKECSVGEGWRAFGPSNPFSCQLAPNYPTVTSETGAIRMADLPPTQRQALYTEIITAVNDLKPSQQVRALAEISGEFDVRTGVLAKQVLASLSATCRDATCIANLGDAPVQLRTFLQAQTKELTAETSREAKAVAIRAQPINPATAESVLFILENPSNQLTLASTPNARAALKKFITAKVPADQAAMVWKAAEAKFDATLVLQLAPATGQLD